MNVTDFATFDDDLCSGDLLTDDDIVQIVSGEESSYQNGEELEETIDDDSIVTPSHAQLSDAFDVIYAALLTKYQWLHNE